MRRDIYGSDSWPLPLFTYSSPGGGKELTDGWVWRKERGVHNPIPSSPFPLGAAHPQCSALMKGSPARFSKLCFQPWDSYRSQLYSPTSTFQ